MKNLGGVAEIAGLFKVGRTTVSNWMDRQGKNGFPDPVIRLAMGPVWNIREVVAWYEDYVPIKGRKPGALPDMKNFVGFDRSSIVLKPLD